MSYYARFKEDIKDNDGNIRYKANPKKYTKKTRYAIMDETEDKYLIATKPNDTEWNIVNSFSKSYEGQLFDIVEE